MKRTMTIAVAAVAVSGLAACGSSGGVAVSTPTHTSGSPAVSTHSTTRAIHTNAGSPTPSTSSTSPTPTATATMVSDSFKWSHSLCSRIDVNKVAKVVKAEVVVPQTKVVTSDVGYVTFDSCQYALQGETQYSGHASYGISADTWTEAEWDEQLRLDLKDNETDKAIKIGSHKGMADKVSGYVLVGNRLVEAVGNTETTREQIVALLKLAVPQASSVKPWPALLGKSECAKGNAAAASAIGGPATIRRDDTNGSVICGWAVHQASASIYGMPMDDAAKAIKDEAGRVPKSEKIKGLGEAAVYFPNGELHVATKKSEVTVDGTGEHVTKAKLVALAKAMLPSY
ncbi:hypothetical protein [Flexivirga sp. B27]